MLTRFKLLLLTAIPTGITLLCLLWKYGGKRKSIRDVPEEGSTSKSVNLKLRRESSEEVSSPKSQDSDTGRDNGNLTACVPASESNIACCLTADRVITSAAVLSKGAPCSQKEFLVANAAPPQTPEKIAQNAESVTESIVKTAQNGEKSAQNVKIIAGPDDLLSNEVVIPSTRPLQSDQMLISSKSTIPFSTPIGIPSNDATKSIDAHENGKSAGTVESEVVPRLLWGDLCASPSPVTYDPTSPTSSRSSSGVDEGFVNDKKNDSNRFAWQNGCGADGGAGDGVVEGGVSIASLDPAVVAVGSAVIGGGDCTPGSENKKKKGTRSTPTKKSSPAESTKTATNESDAAGDATAIKFDFPSELCGLLIGRLARNINLIKQQSGAMINVKSKIYSQQHQVVSIEGSSEQVNKALELIKRRFPARRYPELSYSECRPDVAPEPTLPEGLMQLSLPMGVSLDVFLSSVVTPNHVFLQQPTHPTFPVFQQHLTSEMKKCYDADGIPGLPRPLEVGVVCAAPIDGGWYRAQLVQADVELDECDLRLVDIGGYLHVHAAILKQIRTDFMSLPFQAIECYLAGVIPPTDEEGGLFPDHGCDVLEELAGRHIISAQVVAVEGDGTPYVHLTSTANNQIVDINRQLVEAGVARWYEMESY